MGTAHCARSARAPGAPSVALCGQRVAVPPIDGASGSFGQPGGSPMPHTCGLCLPSRAGPPPQGKVVPLTSSGSRGGGCCARVGHPLPRAGRPRCSHRRTGSRASLVAQGQACELLWFVDWSATLCTEVTWVLGHLSVAPGAGTPPPVSLGQCDSRRDGRDGTLFWPGCPMSDLLKE